MDLNSLKKIFLGLLFAEIVLLCLFLFSLNTPLAGFFHLGLEMNAPSFFSFFQIVFISLLLAVAYLQTKKMGFQLLSLAAFYIALDELLAVHERIGLEVSGIIQKTFEGSILANWIGANHWNPWFGWIFIYIPIIIIAFPFVIKFIKTEQKKHLHALNLVLVGAAVFVAGAIGFEIVEICLRNNLLYIPFEASVLFEEGLEMLGASIIILGLLKIVKGK